MSADWLSKIEPGDIVFIDERVWLRKATVERLTATQIVIDGSKYNRKTGNAIGDFGAWSWRPSLLPVDDTTRARWTKQCKEHDDGRALRALEDAVTAVQRSKAPLTATELAAVKAATEALL